MRLVLDASVALRWLSGDGSPFDQDYARKLLLSFSGTEAEAAVPSLWHIELSNLVARSLRTGAIDEERALRFKQYVANLPITVDSFTADKALGDTLTLAARHRLSSYDACYLELSLRLGWPLATLDKDLRRALTAEGGTLFAAIAIA